MDAVILFTDCVGVRPIDGVCLRFDFTPPLTLDYIGVFSDGMDPSTRLVEI